MPTSKRYAGPGVLVSAHPVEQRHGAAARMRGKRNPWVVLAFMGLLVATWINALL